jgi:signal transduction histidine kinase/ligand-binding sensor domain-containing protein/AraC-like DNA-binding protein
MIRRNYIVLWLSLVHFLAAAQGTDLNFQHLSVQEGLSRSWVKCIYQDRAGFLWVGTSDGLNRYDGYDFKIYKYNPGDVNSINSNNVNVIFEDSKGNLWVGTQQGLNIYKRDFDHFESLDLIHNYIDCIFEFGNGELLVGSPGGLFLVDPVKRKVLQIFNDIYAEDILVDDQKNLWLATYNGLRLLDTSDYTFRNFVHDPADRYSISSNILRSLYQDSGGRIWVGTNNTGLCLLEYPYGKPEKAVFKNFRHDPGRPESISMGAVLAISEDSRKNLWIGAENGGLNLVDLKNFDQDKCSFRHYTSNPTDNSSLSSNSIHSIYLDNQNTVWVGTYGGGLNYQNDLLQKFRHYKHIPNESSSLNNNHINAIREEGDFIWLGTEGGLNLMDKRTGQFRHFVYDANDKTSIGSNAVWALCRDKTGTFWVGTWAGGLNRLDTRSGKFLRFLNEPAGEQSIGGNSIYGIINDMQGDLWIALMGGGLNKYDHTSNTFTKYLVDYDNNSISNNWVFTILENSYGELWISTTTAVDMLDRKTGIFTTYTHDPSDTTSISYNGAIVIFEDSNRNLWFGTNAGLNMFQRGYNTFLHYDEGDGLPNSAVKAICEDDHGNLWLSTNNGISKFTNGINHTRRPVFKNYDVSDGLQGNEFNSRSFCKGADGTIYFGGTNGFNSFHPDSIKDNMHKPVIVLTDFLIFNKPADIGTNGSPLKKHISQTRELRLPHKFSVFSIGFAALNYLASDKNQYAFRLDGFDSDWNYVGARRVATYTNLNPGSYTFRVKASNNDGLWNEEGVLLNIVVLPPWWQTLGAKFFYAFAILVSLYYFRKLTVNSINLKNRLRMEQIEKQRAEELNQMKLQFFTNISHELRTPLTLIVGPLGRLRKAVSGSKELELIQRNINLLRHLVDQILDFRAMENKGMSLNLQSEDIIAIIRDTVQGFNDFAEQKNIFLTCTCVIRKLETPVDQDKIEKILANLLINALKYTPVNGKVDVHIFQRYVSENDRGMLKIEISDSGPGIAPENLDKIFERFYTSGNRAGSSFGNGIGLHLTKKLIELHGGEIVVRSTPGEGSVFTLSLPVEIQDQGLYREEMIYNRKAIKTEELPGNDKNIRNSDAEHDKTVLIIDDNAEICDYLQSFLENYFAVVTEREPLKSIEFITEHLPDLIISDVMMPELDGLELCKMIKTDIRFSHIPVILLTAKATTQDQIAGLETGADDYIFKPFDEDLLVTRVKNLIRQREQLREHFIGSDGIPNPKVANHSLDREFVSKIIAIIGENYHKTDFTVNHIIDQIGMSRSVFYKKYKALSDQPINDLVKSFRLAKAKELLLSNSMNISEIAFVTGFNDASYFGKVFREEFKMTPKDFSAKFTKIS